MKNKMMRTMLGMGGAVVMLLSSIDVYAAPKTMTDGYIHMGRSWENGVTHCMSCIILEDDLRALAEQYQ